MFIFLLLGEFSDPLSLRNDGILGPNKMIRITSDDMIVSQLLENCNFPDMQRTALKI